MKRIAAYLVSIPVLAVLLTACTVSFKSALVDARINTFYVAEFEDNSLNSPLGLDVTVTEALRRKIRTEGRLEELSENSDQEPDVEFIGTLVDFRVTGEAPGANEFAELNRLTIVVAVEYYNRYNEDDNWTSNFSFFFDFPSEVSLESVQDEAIDVILQQINEDIFNKAFGKW
jgi:hypothetical protein